MMARRLPFGSLLFFLLPLAFAGCGASSQPSVSVRPLGVGERWLTVADWSGTACGGVGLVGDYRLRGSATDPHVVWMTDPDGTRHELAWPPGTSARFTPDLEVIGPDGSVVAREGSLVVGRCPVGSTGFDSVELASPPPGPTSGSSGSGASVE